MKKHLFLISVLFICLLCACNETAEQSNHSDTSASEEWQDVLYTSISVSPTDEYVAQKGVAYLKGLVAIVTHEQIELGDHQENEPFDFCGVSILKIQNASAPDRLDGEPNLYQITLAPDVDTFEAIEILSKSDVIEQVSPVAFPMESEEKWNDYCPTSPYSTPYKSMSAEERKRFEIFVRDEITICLDYELDLSEFEGDGEHYLFGVSVDEIHRANDRDGFVYKIKYGEQSMKNAHALWVFESHKNVIWAEPESSYGSGDVDQNGIVNSYDCLALKNLTMGFPFTYYEAGYADINIDGVIDKADHALLVDIVSKDFD